MLLLSGSMMAQTFTGAVTNAPIDNTLPAATAEATAAGLVGTIGSGVFVDNMTFDLTHTFDGDLDITLISPMGTSLDIALGNGGAGDDFTGTIIMDGNPSITTGAAPFTGTFEAEGGTFAAVFAGENPNGIWMLNVVDNFAGDNGTLLTFGITFGVTCAIDPVADVVIDNDPGVCGANVTLVAAAPTCTDPVMNDFNAGGLDASGLYPIGVTTVTWDAGGGVTETATVTVNDSEAPMLACPADQTIHLDPGACEQLLSFDVSATDNCPLLGAGPAATASGLALAQGGGSTFDMIYFDVVNSGATDIVVNSFDQGVFAAGSFAWEVYTTPTTATGNETNAAAWTQVGAANVASVGGLATIPLTSPVLVPAGGSVGVAIGVNFPAGFPLLYAFPPVPPCS